MSKPAAQESQPIEQVAIDTIVEMLAVITVAGGYYTDLALGLITSEPASIIDPTAAYVAVVETGAEPMTDSQGRSLPRRSWLNVVIEVCTPRTSQGAYRQSRRARADIVRVLSEPLRTRPDGILSINFTGTQRIVDDDRRAANHIVAQVSARVGLSEPRSPAQ